MENVEAEFKVGNELHGSNESNDRCKSDLDVHGRELVVVVVVVWQMDVKVL